MKRVATILGITILSILLLLLLAFFIGTSSVDHTSYFDTDYYRKTVARLDSIRTAGLTTTYDSIQAGFAKVHITPALNSSQDSFAEGKFKQIPLAGFGARDGKPATGVHDSLFIRTAALKVGNQTMVLVSADLLIMPPNIADSVTLLLSGKGIKREQIFYSATHTHSSLGAWGTGFVGELVSGKENPEVERWLTSQITRAILLAIEDLRPARVGTGNFTVAAFTRNRLIGESGTKNNDFSFIVLEQIGYKKAIIGSYSAHATTLNDKNWEISADYPGYWARKIESTSADYAMFFAGSVGSQSPTGEGDAFDKAKYIGEGLADSLNVRLPNVTLKERITFSCLSLRMNLPDYNIRVTSEINLSTSISKRLLPFSDNVYLQALRIGDMIWISTPSDFSGEFALQLKRALAPYGYNANVTSFNGSYVGYIVPGRYFYLDEYEPKAMGWFGPNMGEYMMDLIRQMSRIITDADNI